MRISVDGSRMRNNKVAFSNLSGIVWTGAYKTNIFFAHFRGEPGASFTKVGLNRTNFNLSN